MRHNDKQSLRLNLGSGPRAVAGWVCIDRSPTAVLSKYPRVHSALARVARLEASQLAKWDADIVRGDIRRLAFPDDSAEYIYSSHALEHVHMEDAKAILVECKRLLRPGGVLRLALPAIEDDIMTAVRDGLLTSADVGLWFNSRLLSHPQARPQGMQRVKARVAGHVHFWQPTRPIVERLLSEVGFEDVTMQSFRTGVVPDLTLLEHRADGMHVEARA